MTMDLKLDLKNCGQGMAVAGTLLKTGRQILQHIADKMKEGSDAESELLNAVHLLREIEIILARVK